MIKGISFDLWGTLIKSNPQFKLARTEWLHQETGLNKTEIDNTINKVKKSFDQNIEKYGLHYSSDFLYTTILKELGVNPNKHWQFKFQSNKMFIEYGAQLYDQDTNLCIKTLAKHYDLHIISNTLLIDGSVIRMWLKDIDMLQYFKSTTFSSDLNKSKPNPEIFYTAHQKIGYIKEHIIHIGDNPICDIEGAKNYGFKTELINHSKSIIKITKDILDGYY